ncbi:MAG: bifunctional phosphopantothenoylcysteine decarboxylase/phosphopantothenate--cysteine ligase CoaBC [Oscillatoriales cyanobacterium]|nr:MAG: bifunctional phosphopantothenoylcysteine decarboxylase/phosphopantothenate--cysteine ligase CoaBC [Oscillatoriales cyanobacterium]
MKGRRILIGVSGGIAAYKVCEVVSTLAKAGAEVKAILTDAAGEFVTPLTFATLSRHPAFTDKDFWQANHGRPLHIQLGEWAEVFAIAPLTANTLAKLAGGFADNLLTNTVLASTCPILLAPAMNTDMWEQPAVQRNWREVLTYRRYHAANPGAGMLACDRAGVGRMAEPNEILPHIESLLYTKGDRDLAGKRVLISAGGTREHLDPVRFIGNPSTGKMGIALAQAALHRGAAVTLVHSITGELPLSGVRAIAVTSAEEMRQAMLECFHDADLTVMAAAVADVKPVDRSNHQKLIGFAAQTGDIVKPALEKLRAKKLDVIAANPIDKIGAGFGSNTNQAILINTAGKQVEIAPCSKLEMAHRLLDFAIER